MIETLIAFGTGYIIYKILSLFIEVRVVSEEDVNKLQDSEFTNSEMKLMLCKIERHDDMFYVWNLQTDTFLVQGKTMDDIVKFFTKHHPNTKVIFDKGDLDGIKA